MELGDKNHQAGWTGYINADVRYDKRLTNTAKIIMVEISALTNMKGYAWCTNQYLADAFDLSRSQVSRIIRRLAECGYINVYLNPGGERYITITSNDRPVPSGFKKDYTKKAEPENEQDDELLKAATTVEELLPEANPVDTSETELRELTTAEQCALQTKNIEADNYDRRGNVIDENLYYKLKLEVIAESDATTEAEKQPEQSPAKQIEANTQPNNTSTEVVTVSNNAPAQHNNPYGSLATPMTSTRKNYNPAEKAFYDAAKALGVSIANHNQARSWVKEVVRTRGIESTVNYFDFMRLVFPKWEYEYKPNIDSAHDLAMKAAKIEQLIQRQQRENARKINYDNIDFYG
jgi:DNA-binding MarR family transcriptional regulator